MKRSKRSEHFKNHQSAIDNHQSIAHAGGFSAEQESRQLLPAFGSSEEPDANRGGGSWD